MGSLKPVPMTDEPTVPPKPGGSANTRRDLLARASAFAMLGGLVAGYGSVGAMAGRYLYPSKPRDKRWLFVAALKSIAKGSAIEFKTPIGEGVTIARRGDSGGVEDFLALSSTCPHLGCQVHWQQVEGRFFCPCHNGTFDPAGLPTGGPPAEAGQALPRYPLKIEDGLLYIEAPTEKLADADPARGSEERTA